MTIFLGLVFNLWFIKQNYSANLQELIFHNSCIFNVPFKDNGSVLICY